MAWTGWSLKEIGNRFREGIYSKAEVDANTYSRTEVAGAVGRLNSPLLDLPLKNSLAMKAGAGSTTFTRTSTATYIDRYGVLQYSSIENPARFEKDGLLIEGASTNLFTYSTDLLDASWNASAGTKTSGHSSPDYLTNAFYFETTVTNTNAIWKSVTFTSNQDTISVFAKAGTSASLSVRYLGYDTDKTSQINISTLTSNDSTVKFDSRYNDGWVRVEIPNIFAGTDLSGSIYFYIATDDGTNYTSTIGNSMYLFAPQAEPLPFATSYIPTTTAQVTRATTNNSITSKYNMPSKEEGTVSLKFKLLSYYDNFNYLFGCYAGSLNNIRAYVSTVGFLTVRSNSATGGLISGTVADVININQVYTLTFTWKENMMYVYLDGVFKYSQSWTGDLFDTDLFDLQEISIGKYAPTVTTLIGNGNYLDLLTYDKFFTASEVALLGGTTA